jgi:tetratricopeptide (TPR) repeat protein
MKSSLLQLLLLPLFFLGPVTLFAQHPPENNTDKARAMEYFVEGINHFENQDYELALDKLTAAHLIYSDDAGINYALSDVYFATGDFSNAAYYGQVAVELEPENKWYQLQMADIYRSAGRNELAVEYLTAVLEFHPRDLDVLFTLAESYIEFGELQKSNEILDRILEYRGSLFEVHLRKFQNYNALGDDENALHELELLRNLNPGNLSTLHTISQYYMELGNLDAAEEVLLEARERNSSDPQTLILLAEVFIANNNWEKLGDTFVMMIEDPLINPSQKMELVRFVYMQEQAHPDEPLIAEQTKKVVYALSEHEPEFGPAQLISADYYMQHNQPEMALGSLERAIEIAPDNAEAWGQRMQILFSLGRYGEVISLSAEANEASPDNAFIQFFTGAAYMISGEHTNAEKWLTEAAMAPARRNFRSVIYGTLGDVRHELDKWDEAEDAYQNAIRLDATNHTALNNYAYYLSLRSERLDEALEMAKRAVDMEPGNAAYLDTIGWIYYKLGNLESAKMYIQQSVDTGQASATVYEHLGDVYNALGDEINARKWWGKALETDPEREHLLEKI